MMGPEAMGITTVTYDWWHDKVCRNFLFGKCPHIVFSNTVSAFVNDGARGSSRAEDGSGSMPKGSLG